MNVAPVAAAALALAALVSAGLAPSAGAAEPVCVPVGCEIVAVLPGFAPPVAVVPSGATVHWRSLDGPHTASEDATGASASPCFDAFFTSLGRVSFTLGADGLVATAAGAAPRACADAVVETDGSSATVHYNCRYHPNMVGSLTILAETV